MNQNRFGPKNARLNIPQSAQGRHYNGPELPQPVPSLPQGKAGHQEADGGGAGGQDSNSEVSSYHNKEAKIPQEEATCSIEVDKNRNQTIKVIETNKSPQSGNGSGSSGNSLAKLNRMELSNLVDNPQTANPKARNGLDKAMQVKTFVFFFVRNLFIVIPILIRSIRAHLQR